MEKAASSWRDGVRERLTKRRCSFPSPPQPPAVALICSALLARCICSALAYGPTPLLLLPAAVVTLQRHSFDRPPICEQVPIMEMRPPANALYRRAETAGPALDRPVIGGLPSDDRLSQSPSL